ncbi:cobalamin B12-binding domain-containing protein [Candidatus Formimonas warabiya]|uniref:Cobalamin-binding protein n=1 Tax=Formimonas warabiya TaxID=1761012 RepID=A0A3G1KQM3_FORW1|nr:cobalamin-dependent protein [Candidatus Formimonas warabiya]ATW24772.1 cobalamin-binding protein [Candidatus Formimonas warabiya]
MKIDFIDAIVNLDEKKVLEIVQQKISSGESPFEIVEQCRTGVEIIGKKYSEGHYFLADLVMSERIIKGVMKITGLDFLENESLANKSEQKKSIVFGTVKGDIHDLGKNLVVYLLRSSGFCVYDLGVDVPAEAFIASIRKTGSRILALSVLLTSCFESISQVIRILEETGLRQEVTVVIGGYPVNDTIKNLVGADYFANNGTKAKEIFEMLVPKKDEQ